MIHGVCRDNPQGTPCTPVVTIHDSILTTADSAEYVFADQCGTSLQCSTLAPRLEAVNL